MTNQQDLKKKINQANNFLYPTPPLLFSLDLTGGQPWFRFQWKIWLALQLQTITVEGREDLTKGYEPDCPNSVLNGWH